MFVDRAKIQVKAGDGGDGCLAFRREKFVPRGGPSGGDGGTGGNVILISSSQLNSLISFRYRQHFKAARGGHGSGNRRNGKNGVDMVISVPVGTQVIDPDKQALLFDFTESEMRFVAANGGLGGRGNAAFATSTNQAPRRVEPGRSGESKELLLELKILADVGLIGFPNAGKSTLISVVSEAKPKIADYPFTTLIPQLGVVLLEDFRSFVVADIPGLIEGAHEGSGLGDQFLRHIERCRLLIHLVDVSLSGPENPSEAVRIINRELELYDPSLSEKPQLLVASKIDAADSNRLKQLEEVSCSDGVELLQISSAANQGIKELILRIDKHLREMN
jgi:GTP-binding protein